MIKKVVLFTILLFTSINFLAQEDDAKLLQIDIVGKKIDSTLTEGNPDYMNKVFNVEAFSDNFLVKKGGGDIKSFNSGFLNGFNQSFKYGNIIKNHIDNGARYDFMRSFKDENGRYIMQFRLYGDGLNYHNHYIEFLNNEPRITDTYVFITGENLSETIGNMYKGFLVKSNSKNYSKLKKSLDDVELISKIRALLNEGKNAEAKEIYNQISDKSKKRKFFKLINVLISSGLEDNTYKKALEDFETSFPNDPSLSLISIDSYVLKQEYDDAIKSIDKLDAALNGDSFLDSMRAGIYYLKKDYKKAETLYLKVMNAYPDFIEPADSLLSIYIETNKNKKAIDMLEYMVNDFYLPKDILAETVVENFPEFAKTEEFKKWSKKE